MAEGGCGSGSSSPPTRPQLNKCNVETQLSTVKFIIHCLTCGEVRTLIRLISQNESRGHTSRRQQPKEKNLISITGIIKEVILAQKNTDINSQAGLEVLSSKTPIIHLSYLSEMIFLSKCTWCLTQDYCTTLRYSTQNHSLVKEYLGCAGSVIK